MFDIGWSELLVIAVVALVVIGPKELPGVLRSLGHWMGKIRRMASEFQSQFQEAMREAEMADLKKHADDLSQSVRDLTSGVDPYGIARDVEASITGAAPATPPATEPAAAPVPAASEATPAPVPVAESTPVADAPATAPDTPPPVKGAA